MIGPEQIFKELRLLLILLCRSQICGEHRILLGAQGITAPLPWRTESVTSMVFLPIGQMPIWPPRCRICETRRLTMTKLRQHRGTRFNPVGLRPVIWNPVPHLATTGCPHPLCPPPTQNMVTALVDAMMASMPEAREFGPTSFSACVSASAPLRTCWASQCDGR